MCFPEIILETSTKQSRYPNNGTTDQCHHGKLAAKQLQQKPFGLAYNTLKGKPSLSTEPVMLHTYYTKYIVLPCLPHYHRHELNSICSGKTYN